MAFSSESGQMIADTAERILAAHCTPDAVLGAEGGWLPDLWRDLAAAGVPLALEPEGRGAFGIPAVDAMALAQAAGLHAAPVPLVEALLGNWLLAAAGLPTADGVLTVAGLAKSDTLRLTTTGAGWQLTGHATGVPWARVAEALVVVVSDGDPGGDRVRMACVPRDGLTITEEHNLAREPRDRVCFDLRLDDAAVGEIACAWPHLRARGAALRVMQIAGAAQRIVELTTGYAQERVQFGRPIGKFQAVQSNIAIMGGEVAAARAAAMMAARAFDTPDGFFALAAAKARASEAAGTVARYAHQVHGAIGFTQDYQLHLFTKRLWSWRDELGNEAEWAGVLGAEVLDRGHERMWDFITSGLAGVPAPAGAGAR